MPTENMPDLRPIFDQIAHRKAGTRWGIGTAAAYLRQLEPVWWAGQVGGEEWAKAIKAAESRLVYCDPDMEIQVAQCEPGSRQLQLTPFRSPDGDTLHIATVAGQKRAKREETEGAVMEFDATITSARMDRDGDILEPKGAEVDPRLALLWQHNHWDPIGKLIEVTRQNSRRVDGRFAIADTALGSDAAQLVEFGALRLSHGFLPKEWTELRDKKTDHFLGWHITKYEILEVSLVSVPSNVDTIITAYSSEKLHHPAVKAWAKAYHDSRPIVVPGLDFKDMAQKAAEEADADAAATSVTAGEPAEKSGRAISKANEQRIKDSRDDAAEIVGHTEENRTIRALAVGIASRLGEVLQTGAGDDDDDKTVPMPVTPAAAGVVMWVMNAPLAEKHRVADILAAEIKAEIEQREREAVNRIIQSAT